MRTYLDFESKKWVSEKPKRYWTGLICEKTGEKIFIGDLIKITRSFDKSEKIKPLLETNFGECFHFTHTTTFQRCYKPVLISH